MCRAPRPCNAGGVLLKLTGSSCSGKSTLAFAVADRLRDVVVHDFDEVGVPRDPDPHWRHRNTELWVRRALEYQERGLDLLLTGQSPLGEVLAAPSAPEVDGIALCLVDVDDEIRRARLAHRDSGRWDTSEVDAFLGWAAWHRGHARDPRHLPEAITNGSAPDMVWHRWTDWTAGDPRWSTHILDTTDEPVSQSVDKIEQWVVEQRAAHRSGRLPLALGWVDQTT